jgi:nucleoside-diphosphate-sugar epimerase
MKVLVTGANGFLGNHVVKRLLARGTDKLSIRCLVRKGSDLNGLDEGQVDIFRGSLNDEAILAGMLDEIDTVIHLAASMGGSPMGMFTETVVSTENLVNAIKRSSVSRIVFCSSFSVYGASELSDGDVFDEHCPIEKNPAQRDAYAWCKYYQERWLRENIADQELVILRPGVIYGEGKGLLSPRLGMTLPGLPVFLKIGGRARMPLTHVKNCADAFALATLKEGLNTQIFNVVDDECPTQNEYLALYQRIIAPIPRKVPVPYMVFWLMSFSFDYLHKFSGGNFPGIFSVYKVRSMYRRFQYSNSKIKTTLGWVPEVSLREGLMESKEYL